MFADYAKYYNLIYSDKDYAGESSYIVSLLQQYLSGAKSILELGSGTGRHAAYLADTGYSIHGIELSEEMLEQARLLSENNSRLAFTRGDMRNIRLNMKFDVVLSLFHVLSYQTTNSNLVESFRTMREHLAPGGLLIFDCWYGPCVLSEQPSTRVKRVSDDSLEVTRLVEPELHPNENVVDVKYQIFVRNKVTESVHEIHETHRMRYMFIPEIEMLLEQHGFRLLHAGEWLTGNTLSCNTFGACFVAQLT